MLDFVNKAKWDAWKSLGSITQVRRLRPAPCGAEEERAAFHQLSPNQDEARQEYCHLIGSLVAAEGGDSTHGSSDVAAGSSNYETLLVSRKDNVTTITLNRPAKKNAITNQVCVLHSNSPSGRLLSSSHLHQELPEPPDMNVGQGLELSSTCPPQRWREKNVFLKYMKENKFFSHLN